MKTFYLKIYRGTPGHQYWETFELPFDEQSNIISCLMRIRENPINSEGDRVAPVVWEDGCLEEVCGSCSMLVDQVPRQACSALIKHYIYGNKQEISLAPLTKFPLIRDLIVDRKVMFTALKKIAGYIETEGSIDGKGPGPKIYPKKQEVMHVLATCMTCGCCSEACPQVNGNSEFMGPAPISQARLFNTHPTGAVQKEQRLRPLMEKGGIAECGNAQNCVKVCPKNIPLDSSIAVIGRDVTIQALRDKFSLSDR